MKKAMDAEEFFGALAEEKKVVELSGGLRVEIRKVDVPSIMTSVGDVGLPAYGEGKDDPKAKPLTAEQRKKSHDNLNDLLCASTVSPKFVRGDGFDAEKNEIGLDNPKLSSGVKMELLAHVLEFNGFSGLAANFFRLVRGEELGLAGLPGETVRQASPRVGGQRGHAVATRPLGVRCQKGHASGTRGKKRG